MPAGLLAPDSETSGPPRCHWAGGIVCVLRPLRPSLVVCSFPLTLTCRQTDGVCLGHAVASPGWVRPSANLVSICSLPSTDPETAGLSVASLPVAFLYWGGEGGPREEGLGDDEVGKTQEGSV